MTMHVHANGDLLGLSMSSRSENIDTISNSEIWVVTYWDTSVGEPTITAFTNEEAAERCYQYCQFYHAHCCIDKVKLHSKFTAELVA